MAGGCLSKFVFQLWNGLVVAPLWLFWGEKKLHIEPMLDAMRFALSGEIYALSEVLKKEMEGKRFVSCPNVTKSTLLSRFTIARIINMYLDCLHQTNMRVL